MADVRPLQGIRFSQKRVGSLAEVITPPYDVINQEAQARYYERSPYNSIRIELGKESPNDNTLDNVYTRAAATLAEWRHQGVLYQERKASYYLYQQKFHHRGESFTRTSLLARVRLEPWSARVVLPHEHTTTKAKNDRLQLYRACATNTSPIMCLYEDPQSRLRQLLTPYTQQPEVHITDEVGEEHLLQPIQDEEQIALIQDFFSQRQLYIADGHHRYETALNYRAEVHEQRRELHPDDAVNFTLMALIDVDDPGMLVLPTHRLLSNLSDAALEKLTPQHLGQFFHVQSHPAGQDTAQILSILEAQRDQQHALVVHTPEQTLSLQMNADGQRFMAESKRTESWNVLDVAIAQRLILEALLGLRPEDMTAGTYVRYSHEPEQVLEEVRRGSAQAALLLNATPLRQVCDVAQADERMPQKSTYLYPKLITGLVMNPLW
ncbi:MAG TPA: DUF1015 domain-containing protein [Ktedonobacteraceae bacterium]|jgi:uncharacterized protein (DUF1015 family)